MSKHLSDFNFVRVAVVSPELKVAAVNFNTEKIISAIGLGINDGASLFLFPELSLTSYSCGDLFYQSALHSAVGQSLEILCGASEAMSVSLVVGAPIQNDGKMFNCAIFISNGEIKGIVPKTFIPNNDEYYEERWFSGEHDRTSDYIEINGEQIPFGADLIFRAENSPLLQIGIEICEDLWSVVPPSSDLALSGCNAIFNLSASSEYLGKSKYRRDLVVGQSARCQAAYLYSSAGPGESSTDFITSGHCLIAENGTILAESKRFSFDTQMIISDIDLDRLNSDRLKNSSFAIGKSAKDFREIEFSYNSLAMDLPKRFYSRTPFVPSDLSLRHSACEEVLEIQSTALAKRLLHIGAKSVTIGLSGGLDSTLAFIVCLKAFEKINLDKSGILAVSMPGFGTSNRTKSNAQVLAELFDVQFKEIDISDSVLKHFDDISHNSETHDVVYENAQARMRTMILMDLANKHSGIVVGTGDLSEAALGWSTYNGDHISMYSVNSGVPKTLVQYIISWAAENMFDAKAKSVLYDILETPISPELLPTGSGGDIVQETEKIVGPYILNDFFLYYFVRFNYSPSKILLIAQSAFGEEYTKDELRGRLEYFLRRFFANQYKRSCTADGVKIGSVALSPRGDWRMPSDATLDLWLEDLLINDRV